MASELQVDELKGVTAAGDITITSEGGSATMQLQQGLTKLWINLNNNYYNGHTIRDSFNVASTTDNSVGNADINATNAMGNANYQVSGFGSGNLSSNTQAFVFGVPNNSNIATMTTTALEVEMRYGGTSGKADAPLYSVSWTGDLA